MVLQFDLIVGKLDLIFAKLDKLQAEVDAVKTKAVVVDAVLEGLMTDVRRIIGKLDVIIDDGKKDGKMLTKIDKAVVKGAEDHKKIYEAMARDGYFQKKMLEGLYASKPLPKM